MLQNFAIDVNSSYQNTNSTGNGTTQPSGNGQGSSTSAQPTNQTQTTPTVVQETSQTDSTPNYTFYATVMIGILILVALIVIIRRLSNKK